MKCFLLACLLTLGCSTPAREVEGHARNAAIGVEHAAALNRCLETAKAADAGAFGYVMYEDCAAREDVKFGKKAPR